MKLLKWLAISLTGLMLFVCLSTGQILSSLLLILATALFIPWSRHWFVRKLPILANPAIQSVIWIVLFFSSCGTIEATAEISGVNVCHELQQSQCAETKEPFLAKSPKLYLTGEAKHVREQSELKLTLQKQVAGGSQLVDTMKVKPSLKKLADSEQLSLEFQPKELPAGDYVLNIESSQGRFKPISQSFSVWDAAIGEMKICGELQRGICAKDASAFVRDRDKIYLSAASENIKAGMDVEWSLKYTPEPGNTKAFENQTIQAELENDQLVLPIDPKSLPIGTYELTLNSPQKRFKSQQKQFTVWPSAADATAQLDDSLRASTARLGQLNLCDRSGKPIPQDEPIEETIDPKTGKKVQKTRKTYDRNFCTSNAKELPASASAFGFQLDLAGMQTSNNVKITWIHPRSGPEGQSAVSELSPDTAGLNYTLTSGGGFPPGDYALVVSLETQGARPLYREFKVK